MKKNVLSLSIQAMLGGYDGRQSVECIDCGPAGHVLVVPYFEHQSSPILRFINQAHYRIDTSHKRGDR